MIKVYFYIGFKTFFSLFHYIYTMNMFVLLFHYTYIYTMNMFSDYFSDVNNVQYEPVHMVLRRLQADKDRDVRQYAVPPVH